MAQFQYRVEVIGFSQDERRLFDSTFALSERRTASYIPFVPSDRDDQPDLILVDADNMSAMVQAMQRHPSEMRPLVLVATTQEGHDWPVVPRPIKWTRLFTALDECMHRATKAKLALAHSNNSFVGDYLTDSSGAGRSLDLHLNTNIHGGQGPDSQTGFTSTMPIGQLEQYQQYGRERFTQDEFVLSVDTDAIVRQHVARCLLPFGLQVDFAESAEQAIAMIDYQRYTVVIADVGLPRVDGFTLTRLIKARPSQQTPRVVLMAQREGTFDRIRARMVGCDAFLAKPLDEDLLVASIARFLPQTQGSDWVAAQTQTP